MTILSVNLLKNRFIVEWVHFHAHDSPTGQSRQRFRGHTRHGDTTSLTIPAAIVLGTAVVATTLPLPGSTPATATGTAHVTRAYTDKSTHEPGTQATITAEASSEGTVHFSVSHLGVEIASGEAPITDGAATWTYTTPSEDNQGYPGDRYRCRRYARRNRAGRFLQLDTLPTHGGSTPPRERPSPRTT